MPVPCSNSCGMFGKFLHPLMPMQPFAVMAQWSPGVTPQAAVTAAASRQQGKGLVTTPSELQF